jgi:hypothetical protein
LKAAFVLFWLRTFTNVTNTKDPKRRVWYGESLSDKEEQAHTPQWSCQDNMGKKPMDRHKHVYPIKPHIEQLDE